MTLIRSIRESDAKQFLDLTTRLDHETPFMMLEPGERTRSVPEERERIRKILARSNQTILVAEENGRLVGYLAAFGGDYRRSRRTALIVVGVLQNASGRGIATTLFTEIESWARQQDMHRLELTVMAHNRRALALYCRMGFQIEGILRDSLWIHGEYVDEYSMGKLL